MIAPHHKWHLPNSALGDLARQLHPRRAGVISTLDLAAIVSRTEPSQFRQRKSETLLLAYCPEELHLLSPGQGNASGLLSSRNVVPPRNFQAARDGRQPRGHVYPPSRISRKDCRGKFGMNSGLHVLRNHQAINRLSEVKCTTQL